MALFYIVHTDASAYALSNSLMKPFKAELENLWTAKDYNDIHHATRVSVEIDKGRLKLKLGCLTMIRSSKTDTIRRLIIRYSISLFWLRTASQKLP